MTQATKLTSRRQTADCSDPDDAVDAIDLVGREFGNLMISIGRYKHSVGENRIDRMALMVLGTLSNCGASRMSALAERLGFDASTVSRQVADLEKAGLLVREPDPEDRRAVLLKASRKGLQMMTRLHAGRRKRLERLLSGWSEHDISELGRLLGQLNVATEIHQDQNTLELEEELNHG